MVRGLAGRFVEQALTKPGLVQQGMQHRGVDGEPPDNRLVAQKHLPFGFSHGNTRQFHDPLPTFPRSVTSTPTTERHV